LAYLITIIIIIIIIIILLNQLTFLRK